MKNLAIFAIGVFTFALPSCKNVDKGLVQEMQQTAGNTETLKPAAESAAQSVADFKNKVMALQDATEKGGAMVISTQLEMKYNAMLADYKAAQEELKKLTAEYEDGKIKTEAVSVRFTELKEQMANIEASMNKLKEIMARPMSDLAKLGNEMAKDRGVSASDAATTQRPSDAQSNVTGQAATSPDATPSDAKISTNPANAPLTGDGTTKKGKQ